MQKNFNISNVNFTDQEGLDNALDSNGCSLDKEIQHDVIIKMVNMSRYQREVMGILRQLQRRYTNGNLTNKNLE